MTVHDVIAVIFYVRAHMEKEAGAPSPALTRTAGSSASGRALAFEVGAGRPQRASEQTGVISVSVALDLHGVAARAPLRLKDSVIYGCSQGIHNPMVQPKTQLRAAPAFRRTTAEVP